MAEHHSSRGGLTPETPPPLRTPMGTRQFGGINLAGDNSTGQICRQANLSASQFGGKINKNNLPSLALKRQQKSFVMSLRQLQLFS